MVALSGDYDFQFMIEELAVGAQFKLPYIHVLVNNAYLGLIRQSQRGFEMDFHVQLSFDNVNAPEVNGYGVDHVKVAEGLGCKAIRVFDPDELPDAFEQAKKLMAEFRVPVVVEVILERVTNISMGTELDNVTEFEELALSGEDAPTAISHAGLMRRARRHRAGQVQGLPDRGRKSRPPLRPGLPAVRPDVGDRHAARSPTAVTARSTPRCVGRLHRIASSTRSGRPASRSRPRTRSPGTARWSSWPRWSGSTCCPAAGWTRWRLDLRARPGDQRRDRPAERPRSCSGSGGSASTDGGAGMVQALGARLPTATAPTSAAAAARWPLWQPSTWTRLRDAGCGATRHRGQRRRQPAARPDGAAAVFGPQKGADRRDVAILERGLADWAGWSPGHRSRPRRAPGGRVRPAAPGSRPLALLDAQLRPGIELILELSTSTHG